MASPFSVFRKHRKAMLAALTILTMFGFVFLPIMLETMGSRGATDPVVVRTSKFGKIYQSQLSAMLRQRERVRNVLIGAMSSTGIDPNQAANEVNMLIGDASEESVVNGWLQARQAEQLGLVVTTEAIKSFLREITRNSLKPNDLRTIFSQQHFSEYQFFQAFHDELLALRLQRMFLFSLGGAPPAQRWDYYTRVKRKATVEVLPVAVERFVSQVPDPDDATLRKFFEQHKDKIKTPDSPEPGFREPQKVKLRYFKAELEKFMAQVTDEEIKQEYEKNKDSYDKQEAAEAQGPALQKPPAEKPVTEPSPPADKAATEAPKSEAPESEKPATEKPAGDTPKSEKPAGETPKSEKPAAEKPSGEKSEGEKPSGEQQGGGTSKKPSTQEEPASKSANPGGAASARAASPFRLAAFLQDQPAEDKSSQPKAAVEKPADSADAHPNAEPTQGEKPSASAAPSGKAGENAQQPKEHPSVRIKDQIRSNLAMQRVAKVFQELQKVMLEYGNKWRIDKAKGKDVASLPAPDFPALAKENQLSWEETGLASALQLMGLEIGGSYVDSGGYVDFRQPVLGKAFGTSLLLYRPETSLDLRRNRYLFWKVEETKEETPKFDQEGVRQRVLHAWKMIEARGLTKKEAERLAAEARNKAKDSLADVFRNQADIHVSLTAPFSWLSYANLSMLGSQGRPELSRVNGVDLPGPEFMRTVFDLQPGGAGVAMNHPQTVAYVVRMVEIAPSDEMLWKLFEADPYEKYAAVAVDDQREIYRAWLEELKSSAGLTWAPEHKLQRETQTAETPDE